ncbi:hypothetical protein BJY00DRAFT_215816 [Aspergillus carlsbadensis]|nr:hypothetical protein BJY00DRAFT_215816 [Aspergillus carlsbadensis]
MSNSSSPDPESPGNIFGEIEGCSVERIGRRTVITLPSGVTIVTFGAVTITSNNREAAWRARVRRSGRICTRGPLHARGTIHLPAVPHSAHRRRSPPPRMLSPGRLARIRQDQDENHGNHPIPNSTLLPEAASEPSGRRSVESSPIPATTQSQCRDRNLTSPGHGKHECTQLQKIIQLRDQSDKIFLQELDARLNELTTDANATVASNVSVPLSFHKRCKAVAAGSNLVNLPNETNSPEQNNSSPEPDSDGFVMLGMTPDSYVTSASDDPLRP